MPVIPIQAGNNITAEQFNELVSLYDAYWQGATYTYDADHSTEADRRKGWGQPAVIPTVSQNTIITAEHTNYLLSQINAGLWHIEEDQLQLQTHRSPNTAITASVYTALTTVYDTIIDPNKFVIDPTSKSLNANVVSTVNPPSSPWDNDLYCEHTFTFNDYNEARHFFNSGGELLVDMSSSSGGTNDPSVVWNIFFDNLGVVRIGAETTANDGDGDGDPPFNSSVGNKGFYNINGSTLDWTTIYDVAADDGGSDDGGVYGNAGNIDGGIYTTRRFRLDIKGIENPSTLKFEIHLKIILIEDIDDIPSIDANIVAELGYAQPLDTPEPSESSGSDKFSPEAGVDYIFAERNAPLIVNTVAWTQVDIIP